MRISDWSSDVCSSDLAEAIDHEGQVLVPERGHAHVAPEIFTGPHRVFDAELGLEIDPDVHALDRRAYPAGAELDDAEAQAREALEHAAHHHRLQVEFRSHVRDQIGRAHV